MEELKVNSKKRGRVDSEEPLPEAEIDSPEVKRLREDLLDSFDDDVDEFSTANQDLDSFMKSFEEEITASPTEVVDFTSEACESRPDLGYLLEASDDELGLPPTTSPSGVESELVRGESGSSEFGGEFWELPGYDDFGFEFGEYENYGGENGDFVALDGLFDYSDLGYGSSGFSWKPEFETLPAQ